MGDGGINNPWQANITLNATTDAFFIPYVVSLCEKLFGTTPAVRKRKGRNAIVVSLASTSVVDFLVKNGLPRGDKIKNGLRIPSWVLSSRKNKLACVRGLVDTDGCLYIHKHRVSGKIYKNIGLCFTSASPALIYQVAAIFEENGIIPHISGTGRDIYLYRKEVVRKYISVFGTSNHRLLSVYNRAMKIGEVAERSKAPPWKGGVGET